MSRQIGPLPFCHHLQTCPQSGHLPQSALWVQKPLSPLCLLLYRHGDRLIPILHLGYALESLGHQTGLYLCLDLVQQQIHYAQSHHHQCGRPCCQTLKDPAVEF